MSMTKFTRVTGALPVGVVIRVSQSVETVKGPPVRAGSFSDIFASFDAIFAEPRAGTIRSTAPVDISLDVPEGDIAATAAVLRKLADQLEGKS